MKSLLPYNFPLFPNYLENSKECKKSTSALNQLDPKLFDRKVVYEQKKSTRDSKTNKFLATTCRI